MTGSFIRTTRPLTHHIGCRVVGVFFVKHQITQVTQPSYSPDLAPCDFWLFPKLKSPLKGKSFQVVNEIQENMMGQLTANGRTVWGPKVPTLKGTEASFSYVRWFLYLVFCSINVSLFHSTWLDIFWTDVTYSYIWIHIIFMYIYIIHTNIQLHPYAHLYVFMCVYAFIYHYIYTHIYIYRSVQKVSSHVIWKIETFIEEDTRFKKHCT